MSTCQSPPKRPKTSASYRAVLACLRCRQRKVRCSGEWPSCGVCQRRSQVCVYDGNHPGATTIQCEDDDGTELLPSSAILRKAVTVFLEYYADSIFWFLRKHTFLDDLAQERVPTSLLLCILAVVARFIEPCYKIYGGTLEASDHFAALARKSMARMYDEITILTLQCNLVLCVHEIGNGNEHRAWMQLGIAIRIAQVMKLSREDSFAHDTVVEAESKRRTFWSCFALDRLIANGNDRRLSFSSSLITTRLPCSNGDFILGCKGNSAFLHEPPSESDSLLAFLLRIINIQGEFLDWSGAGGRNTDQRCPWLPEMPMTRFWTALDDWKMSLPSHMTSDKPNLYAHVAAGEGRAFGWMHLFFLHACVHLHREYVPFVPPLDYDPGEGPGYGPTLLPGPEPPAFWWYRSIREGTASARRLSIFYSSLDKEGLTPWASPFAGYCLMTSSIFHILCYLRVWKSCEEYIGGPAKVLLIADLRHLIHLQESWPVAAHWVKTLRLFYEKISLVNQPDLLAESRDEPAASRVRAAVLHYDQSDNKSLGLTQQHMPRDGHDMFALFNQSAESAMEKECPQPHEPLSLEGQQVAEDMSPSSDDLLQELLDSMSRDGYDAALYEDLNSFAGMLDMSNFEG